MAKKWMVKWCKNIQAISPIKRSRKDKKVNELHDWIEKHPHIIQYQNISDPLFVKINYTLVKKQKNLLQISVWELHNDLILTIYQGGSFGTRNVDRKLCIGDTSIRRYTLINIKPRCNRNVISCKWKICISAMLLQSDMNKWQ